MSDKNTIIMDPLTIMNNQETTYEAARALMNSKQNIRITVPMGEGDKRKMVTIPCFNHGGLQISGLGNDWGELLDFGIFNGAIDSINDIVTLFNTVISTENDDGSRVGGAAQIGLKSRHMTAASWKGSTLPTFSTKLIFLSLSPDKNPVDTFLALAKAVLPNSYEETGGQNQARIMKNALDSGTAITARAASGVINFIDDNLGTSIGKKYNEESLNNFITNMTQGALLEAPCGYGLNALDTENYMSPRKNTTLQLQIGKWFQASNLLVVNLGGVQFSRQVMQGTGNPLYIMCDIVLRPYKMITYEEFVDYFLTTRRRETY